MNNVFCFFYSTLSFTLFYDLAEKFVPSVKKKAYILSLKNSFVLSLCGIYYNYLYLFCGVSVFPQAPVIYFISYLLIDSCFGYTHYPNYFYFLSGKLHHFTYIIVGIISLYLNLHWILNLLFIEEIPTFILALGVIDENLRSNKIFGISFFITRIFYHLIMVLFLNKESVFVAIIGSMSFLLHNYWFNNWRKKYLIM